MPNKKPSQPCTLDIQFRGIISGLTYLGPDSQPLCHFFGGIPYALPPIGPFRFQKPRALPACYRYGTKVNPGVFTGGCGLCPQPGFLGEDVDENKWDEDCLQSNVWIPAGEAPAEGWPVLVWIHGGFLQFGSPNDIDLRALLSESPCKCIVVAPAYRLNIFGFLASSELHQSCSDSSPNLGFWDQRMALEWTWKNISYFGGNASNITLGGYSAGSHSVFYQLAYDLDVPESKAIIKRALMLSNGPGIQPKSLEEAHDQFTQLIVKLGIPTSLPPGEKLAKLRKMDAKSLIAASHTMNLHQFRAATDSSFVRPNLLSELSNGVFANRLLSRNVHLVIGECSDEHFVYGTWRPPKPGYQNMLHRLQADYPRAACHALMAHYFPHGTLPQAFRTWQEAFGHIYADVQIHALQRGMVQGLVRHGAAHLVHRYRIEWRAGCVDKKVPRSWGATHGADMAIWFWGNGERLDEGEKEVVSKAFHEPLSGFLNGEEGPWGTACGMLVRTLKEDGRVVVEEDTRLDQGLKLWEALRRCGAVGWAGEARL